MSSSERDKCRYRLQQHVRVRREGFGLLFYNQESASLTFVRSGNLVDVVSGDEGTMEVLLRPAALEDYQKTKQLVDSLVKKNLIVREHDELQI